MTAQGDTAGLKLSVVVATFNRAETLRETIRRLADQELDPACYEVIVVDDGSSDHTQQVVAELIPAVPFQLSYLHHANHGMGYTNNRGLRLARAPVVLLIADDIFMSRQALRAHLAMHEAHADPEVAVLGGVVQSPELNQSVFLRTWDSFRYSDLEGQSELPYYRFWVCNISAKRDFLLGAGGCLEHRGRAGAASHLDTEFGYRLHQRGLRILFCPQALGYHHHVVSLPQACARAYEMGLNFEEFRSYVPEPEIPVVYHFIGWRTVGDHLRTWFGPRRAYLAPRDRNPALLLGRYLLRGLAFNTLTIRAFWGPLFERAERDPAIARLMRAPFYRGMIAYHFFRGCREGATWTETPTAQAKEA